MKRILLIPIVSLSFRGMLLGGVINVPADSTTIQAAINGAVDGDTVLVQPGTYVEIISFIGKNIVVGSLYLTTGDTSYISQTVIDGNSAWHVVAFENGEDSTAVLSGFTIINGSAIGAYYDAGGILCNGSSPRLENLIVREHFSATIGGGIACYKSSSPMIENVTVTGNTAWFGAGLLFDDSSPSLKNVTVTGNTATFQGGGIYCKDSNTSLENVMVSSNTASRGGGIYSVTSGLSMENVTISDNLATGKFDELGGGGGIYFVASKATLDSVTISGNSAMGDYAAGGGIFSDISRSTLLNTTIWNNSARGDPGHGVGGGIFFRGGYRPSILVNVTLSDNVADSTGAIYSLDPWLLLANTIVWNNSPQVVSSPALRGTIFAISSDIQGGWEFETQGAWVGEWNGSTKNIDSDPLFEDPENGDFHLKAGSPCIDSATPFVFVWPDTLLNLNPSQYVGFGPDMGAYEYRTPSILTPAEFFLHQNFPNPFNETTTIRYTLPYLTLVTVVVYDLLGRQVARLVNRHPEAGYQRVVWGGRDTRGREVPTGIYIARLVTPGYTKSVKMVLLK